ncbi:MAG: redoxin domain-containing protein [Acidobacteriota bacterium]
MKQLTWATRCASLALMIALVPAADLAAEGSQAAEASQAERVQVGQAAPDFTLPDPDGTDHSLSTLRGEKNLLMVFFRGAW